MAALWKKNNIMAGKNAEQLELSQGENEKWHNHFGKHLDSFLGIETYICHMTLKNHFYLPQINKNTCPH